MKPGWGYLTFAALCGVAAWFAGQGGLVGVMWGLLMVGVGLVGVGVRRL